MSYRHSFLALGPNTADQILVWEKIGFGTPFRITDFDEVYNMHADKRYWGFKSLETSK